MNRLYRIPNGAVLGGVAAGLARYFRVDVTVVRLIFVLGFFLTHGPFGLVYLILWIALPTDPQPGVDFVPEDGSAPVSQPLGAPNSKLWGAVLIGVGVLFLLDEFVWWFSWHKLWPVLLVALGLYVIFKDRLPASLTNNQPPQNPL
jgi:phage shock protein PspC (stress-responsive transcriptional regulator)